MTFDFRPLRESDLDLLFEWLNRPHLLEWWGGEQSVEQVRAKYLPRIAGLGAAEPFIVLGDATPVGYIQFYRAVHGDPAWWPDKPGEGVFGIDQFLADGEMLGQGIGRQMIAAFCRWLFAEKHATEIRVDPRPDNGRAIRCYERVGFVARREIVTPDGPALWMQLSPAALSSPETEE